MPDNSINTLNQIISGITLYVPYFTIIFGTLGSIFNLLTFTSRQLWNNTCGLYFLCSAIFDLIYLMVGALTRLMSDHYPYVLPSRSVVYCKLRYFVSIIAPTLATFFVALASIDRCLLTSSSRKWRNFSKIKTARWITIISIVFWSLAFSHTLIFFDLQLINANTNVYACAPKPGIYSTFLGIFVLFFNTIFMYTIMIIPSKITLIRVRASRNRVGNLGNQRGRIHNIDRHLIAIMFVQVGLGLLLTAFRCVFLTYSYFTSNITKDIYRITVESFIAQLSLIVYYLNFAKSFPVNTLTSPLFRNIFWQRMIKIFSLFNRGMFYKFINSN